MNKPARLAVFASGGGTNLQALLNHFNASESATARVCLVVASRPGIGAIGRAERAGVECRVIDPSLVGPAAADPIMSALEASDIDLIVLAGYLTLVPSTVVERYRGRIINIHPALLPAFGGQGMYGMRVHRAVIASGARVSGATIHLVDERYDEGAIIAQWPVPVYPVDTAADLAARVLHVEHLLLPAAIEELVARGGPPTPEPAQTFDLRDSPAPSFETVRRFVVHSAADQAAPEETG